MNRFSPANQQNIQQVTARRLAPRESYVMSDKLSVSIWGASISAEGWIAIIAAVAIVGVLAFVVLGRA